MSKYIKLDDAIDAVMNTEAVFADVTAEPYQKTRDVTQALHNLPTIEVSEDCISREVAIDIIKNYDFKFPQYMERFVTELREAIKKDLVEDIRNAPSAVPSCQKNRQVGRAEGEWIINEPEESGFGAIYECPYCKYEVEFEPTNYCPNCGAKMKG